MKKSIGKRIRELRERHNFTLEDVGNSIGITKQTLYKYEHEIITNIPSDKIEALARVYDVSPAYIMGWEDEDKNPIKRNPSKEEIEEIEIKTIAAHAAGDLSEESIKKIIEYAKFIKAQEKKNE